MSDSGNIHVGDVETLVEATPEAEAPASPAQSGPSEATEEGVRRAVQRMKRDARRTCARGFDD